MKENLNMNENFDMKENLRENFDIDSKIISGTVAKRSCENGAKIEINIKIHGDISPDCVVRAYFAEEDAKNLKPIGIVDNFGHLSAFVSLSDCTDTVVFGIKNTLTDSIDYVGYAYLNGGAAAKTEPAIDNAKKILGDIKSGGNRITPEMRQNFEDEMRENLSDFEKTNITFQNFEIYKITVFKPILNISAVKFAMFERSVLYSFDKFGFYLFGIDSGKIAIAFASENGKNPLAHADNLCTRFEYDGTQYFAVIIELADDGQYFTKD